MVWSTLSESYLQGRLTFWSMREFITKAVIAIGFLLLATGMSFSQDIKFNHITPNDGLANGNVRTILQDYQGFFWFGTEDGLQRYDGYSLVISSRSPGFDKSFKQLHFSGVRGYKKEFMGWNIRRWTMLV